MPTVSALIIAFNEERNIRACIESVAWCDEIIVVDSESTDRTRELAAAAGARVVIRPWPGHVEQKNAALELATQDWCFSLDADERCTPGLRDEIQAALAAAPDGLMGLRMPRLAWHLGRWIRHGGWYPDRKLRVVRRGHGRWGGTNPHDKLEADGEVRTLTQDLLHYTYDDYAHHLRTGDSFSSIAAAQQYAAGRRFSLARAVLHIPVKFLETYIWKRGFLDGWPGFAIAVTSTFFVFARHVKLYELGKKADKPADS